MYYSVKYHAEHSYVKMLSKDRSSKGWKSMRTQSSKQQKLFLKLIPLVLIATLCAACNANPVITSDEVSDEPLTGQPDAQSTALQATIVETPATPVPSPGQVYYVNPDGVDGNGGSQIAPWRTIQYAVDNVSPGDTILLQSGTYAGARIEQSGTAEAWITLQADPGASVLINLPGPNNRHESNLEFETWEGNETVAFWVVDGLEVADAPYWGIDIRGNEENHSHNFIIRNNRVHDNGLSTGKTGIFAAFVDDIIVEGNESYANGEHGIYLSNSGDRFVVRGNLLSFNYNCGLHINGDLESGEDGIISDGLVENNTIFENGEGGCAGINMDGVMDATIRNNLLYQNHASGIALFQENGAVCSQNIQILNNTIVQAEDGRWAIIINGDGCINNKIFNNIILSFHEWRGSILIPSAGIPGFESDFNILMNRFSADDDNSVISLSKWQALGYDVNSMVSTPDALFMSSEDYHLHEESPAVDAGQPLQDLAIDMEGVIRPQGVASDIGAFEFGAAPSGQSPATETSDLQNLQTAGTITYVVDGRAYRIIAQEGMVPEDIGRTLDSLAPGGGDGLLNISPDGAWLVLETERFDPECDGWACLAVIAADLSTGEAIRANGELVHTEGISAVGPGGNLVVYPFADGPHDLDLWAVSRSGDAWGAPILLTENSPYAFNFQPALSDDGSKVVFNCGFASWGDEGTAICEVGTDGAGFRVVLTPADAPTDFPASGALHHPDYAPNGSIVFEGDWGSEQIWRLLPGASEPILIGEEFNNDNSPCVLPDGRIVSLWLNKPGGDGLHEIKVMAADGSSFIMVLPDVDVLDAGIGCGP